MKRGKPLVRTGGLKRSTPLTSVPVYPVRVALARSQGVPQQSAKRRRESKPRRAAETALGRDGAGVGICARCGVHGPVNGHERTGRAQGGDPTRPDCLLCPLCNSWCEDFPVSAVDLGWKVSRKYDRNRYLTDDQAVRTDHTIHTFKEIA